MEITIYIKRERKLNYIIYRSCVVIFFSFFFHYPLLICLIAQGTIAIKRVNLDFKMRCFTIYGTKFRNTFPADRQRVRESFLSLFWWFSFLQLKLTYYFQIINWNEGVGISWIFENVCDSMRQSCLFVNSLSFPLLVALISTAFIKTRLQTAS